ncbi:alpha/beta fold hydrolase [Malonomonas rubra]|uniref:alpha/beta fold hydrolase n=1 Tax=Malonomonas rubra TaxID=57040 RepID=UPI0026F04B1F|nr:alpha/beta hydrolase [Malonomonas rubra]
MAIKMSFKYLATLLLLCILNLISVPVQATTLWPIPEGVKTVEVNGYPMAYQDTGSGTPLVLVHGGFSDYRIWSRKQIPIFSKFYRTIAVSLRHHYPEKWNGVGNDYSIEQHASDVAALIKKLNLGKVHLLGHSRGGGVVFNVAKMHPELIRTLILEDGSIDSIVPETPEKQERRAAFKKRAEAARADLEADNPEKAAQEWWDNYVGPGTWRKFSSPFKALILDNIWSTTDDGDRGNVNCDEVLKFNFPILLFTGEKSSKHYADSYKELRKCRPDLPEPIVVPNATHIIHNTNPKFYNSAVLEFLNNH